MKTFAKTVTIVFCFILSGCAGSYLPLTAPDGTSVIRLSKISGSVGNNPLGGAHADTCQLVQIGTGAGCVQMKQEGCSINTCKGEEE